METSRVNAGQARFRYQRLETWQLGDQVRVRK